MYKIKLKISAEKTLDVYLDAKDIGDAYKQMSHRYFGGWKEMLSIEKIEGIILN